MRRRRNTPGYSTDGLLSGCDSGHDGQEQLRGGPMPGPSSGETCKQVTHCSRVEERQRVGPRVHHRVGRREEWITLQRNKI